MHSCDNPPCVNPDHLSIGTKLDNNRDAISKGRNQHAEHHWNAKLTTEQTNAIRLDPRIGSVIAKEYGISQSAVSRIKTGKRRSKG